MACPTILPETEGGSCQMAGPTQDLLRSVSQSGSPTSWPRLYITSGRRPWAGGCLAHMSMGSSLRSPAAYSARGRTRMRTFMLMASPKAAPMPSSVTCEPRKAFVTLVGRQSLGRSSSSAKLSQSGHRSGHEPWSGRGCNQALCAGSHSLHVRQGHTSSCCLKWISGSLRHRTVPFHASKKARLPALLCSDR